MIKKFWEYGKFKEYFAWAFENIFALIGTVLLVIATSIKNLEKRLLNIRKMKRLLISCI